MLAWWYTRNRFNSVVARLRAYGRQPFGPGRDAKVVQDVIGPGMLAYCLDVSEDDLKRVISGRILLQKESASRLFYLRTTIDELSGLGWSKVQEIMRTPYHEFGDSPMEYFHQGRGAIVAHKAREGRLAA